MPIYEYKCKCGIEGEKILPLSEFNHPQTCVCGKVMYRKMSVPRPAIFVETGRGRILGTLNQEEDAQDFPGGDKHRDRYEQAMAKGLNYERPLEERVFQGFG